MTSILFGSKEGIEFGPPAEKRSMRAFILAILAHLLLLGALTWGVNWKRSDQASSFEAELWSAVPQQAAPRAIEPPPPPTSPAATPPAPTPPVPKPAPPRVSPETPDADIALEQEKKRKLLEKRKDAEAKKLEERDKLEKIEKADLQAKKELKAKEEVARRKAAEDAKQAEARQDAKDLEKLQQQKLAEATKKQRDDAMKRMLGMAGASGGAEASGTAQTSSGPSAGYGGKVRAKVKPNVLFTDDVVGNPSAEVEVRTTTDGTITGQRLVKSSGNKAWDDAVIKAIIRTETMPRDVDGKVPTPMILEFRPKELL